MVNLNKIYNPCMYNNIMMIRSNIKKNLQPRRVKKFLKVKRDSVRKTGYYIEIEASSESHLCPRVEVSNFSRSTLNEKLVFSRLIKVASLTIFCVPLPSYNFIVSIKDDFYCGYFALRDER